MKFIRYTVISFLISTCCGIANAQEPSNKPVTGPDYTVQSFGCLLPLSGEYKLLGEQVLRGALLAAGSMPPGTEYHVLVKDTGSDEESFDNAVNEMYREGGLSFLVGPLPSKYINRVRLLADSREIPALVFPVSGDEREGGANFIKFYYSLEDQVRTVSEYAARELGMKDFVILYPGNEYGSRMKKIFTRTANSLGAQVIYEKAYDPETRDITGELGWVEAAKPDAVFVADGAESSARILLTLMHATDMREVLFIGPSTWNSPAFINLVGDYIDGFVYRTVFTDFFFYGSDEWSDFKTRFETKYDRAPDFLGFQAYMAVKLLLSVSDGKKLTTTQLVNKIFSEKDKLGYEIVKETNGSYRLSPYHKILSLENGELRQIMRVKNR